MAIRWDRSRILGVDIVHIGNHINYRNDAITP
jgi:hypothetical protein